jgi:hypothetical protein
VDADVSGAGVPDGAVGVQDAIVSPLARIIHGGRVRPGPRSVGPRVGVAPGARTIGFVGWMEMGSDEARCPIGQGGSLAARPASSARLCRWG